MKDLFSVFKQSKSYWDLPKKDRRRLTRSKLLTDIVENPRYRNVFHEKWQPKIDGKQVCVRNVFVGYYPRTSEEDDREFILMDAGNKSEKSVFAPF